MNIIIRKRRILVLVILLMTILSTYAFKVVHGPYLQNVYATEATIVWETDKPSTGWIEIAPDDNTNFYAVARPRFYDTSIGIIRTSKLHSVRLTGLNPNTVYRYRVASHEVKNHGAYTSEYGAYATDFVYDRPAKQFRTLNPQKPETSFLIYNDVHERPYLLEQLGKYVDCKNKDLVIFNGDMMNYFQHDSVFFKGFMDEAVRLFAAEKPLYYVRGNHETRGPVAEYFKNYVCPRQPNLYFTWQQGPVFFIALDTGEDKPDNDFEYSGFTDYDNYRTAEAQWLNAVVHSDAFKHAKYRIVICHIPPSRDLDAWHGEIDVRKKFVPILNSAGIDLMICGHTHTFSYHPSNEETAFPILINSNHGVVAAEANNNNMHVKIVDIDGKTTFEKIFPRRL
jgi:predicted phosphodiesterase